MFSEATCPRPLPQASMCAQNTYAVLSSFLLPSSVHSFILPNRFREAFQSPLSLPPTPIFVWSSVLCRLCPPLSECLLRLRRALPSSLRRRPELTSVAAKWQRGGQPRGAILCCYSITAIGGRCFAGHCGPHPQSAHTRVDVVEWRAGGGAEGQVGRLPSHLRPFCRCISMSPLSGKCLPKNSK